MINYLNYFKIMQQSVYNRFPSMFTYGHKLLEKYVKLINTGYIWGVKNEG